MQQPGKFWFLPLFALSNAVVSASIIYVDSTAPMGGNGAAWTTAFRFIDHAISACTANDEIRVGQGSYFAEFRVWQNGLLISGCYAGLSVPENPDARDLLLYPTTFTGDRNGDDDGTPEHYSDNALVFLTVGEGAGSLSGLRFTGAVAVAVQFDRGTRSVEDCWFFDNPGKGCEISGNPLNMTFSRCRFLRNQIGVGLSNVRANFLDCTFEQHASAAAIVGSGGHPTVLDCEFLNNPNGAINTSFGTLRDSRFIGNGGAGAVSIVFGSISDCYFEGNHSGNNGGAINAQGGPQISACTFVNNSANSSGGAVSASGAVIDACSFAGNTAQSSGGAVSGTSFVGRSTFSANRAGNGGALSGFLRVTACSFSENEAVGALIGSGGAITGSAGEIRDSEFVRNSAAGDGGACAVGGNTAIVNCTFVDNLAVFFGGGVFQSSDPPVVIRNSILWGNSAPYGSQTAIAPEAELRVAFSDIQESSGGIYLDTDSRLIWGLGNIEVNPMFVDAAQDDFRLSGSSQCIDAGENAVVNTQVDLEGNERRLDDPDMPDTGLGVAPIVDIGAYEFDASSPNPGDCVGDTDGNRIVNLQDLATLLAHFGTTSGAMIADGDTNGDGGVDLQDLANLLAHFGIECE